jgi:hypothetical protein
LSINRIPLERSRTEIDGQTQLVGGKKEMFLYNPRLKAAEAGKVGACPELGSCLVMICHADHSQTLIVANEQVEVYVTVQNPFAFDLDIQDLSLM